MNNNDELVKRWSELINEIGVERLLSLPEAVKDVLKNTNDLETKVKMFELILSKLS